MQNYQSMKELIRYVKSLREKWEIYLENPSHENYYNWRETDEIVKYLCELLAEDAFTVEKSMIGEIILN